MSKYNNGVGAWFRPFQPSATSISIGPLLPIAEVKMSLERSALL